MPAKQSRLPLLVKDGGWKQSRGEVTHSVMGRGHSFSHGEKPLYHCGSLTNVTLSGFGDRMPFSHISGICTKQRALLPFVESIQCMVA